MLRSTSPRAILFSILLSISVGCHERGGPGVAEIITPPASTALKIFGTTAHYDSQVPMFAVSIDSRNGATNVVSGLGLQGLRGVQAMASDQATGVHYALSSAGLLVEVDTGQETARVIGPSLCDSRGMTVIGDGRLLAVTEAHLHEIDRTTGEAN